MKKSLFAFSALLILGACSVGPDGTLTLDQAMSEVQNRLPQKVTQNARMYELQQSGSEEGLTLRSSEQITINDKYMGQLTVSVYDGTSTDPEFPGTWENEAVTKCLSYSTITSLTVPEITIHDASGTYTPETGAKFYEVVSEKVEGWVSSSVGGNNVWESYTEPRTNHFIINETAEGLKRMNVYKNDSDNTYSVSQFDIELYNKNIYKKI